jgi:hypothetical protein
MSARADAARVRALVALVETLSRGEPLTLGDIAQAVFGWDPARTFLAIDAAVSRGLIARNAEGHIAPASPANDGGAP